MNDEKTINELIEKHKKLIELEAARNAAFIPLAVMKAEAYKVARDAAEKFNTQSGIQFSTFLVNSLKKLQRTSTTYGGGVRTPENKQFKIQKLNEQEEALRNHLGRAATLNELSEATGFSIQEINSLLGHRKKEVNLNNLAFLPVFINNENDEWVQFVYHDLPERDKYIFEHKTGFGGKPLMKSEDIAKALNTSTATISNRLKLITEQLEKGWK